MGFADFTLGIPNYLFDHLSFHQEDDNDVIVEGFPISDSCLRLNHTPDGVGYQTFMLRENQLYLYNSDDGTINSPSRLKITAQTLNAGDSPFECVQNLSSYFLGGVLPQTARDDYSASLELFNQIQKRSDYQELSEVQKVAVNSFFNAAIKLANP